MKQTQKMTLIQEGRELTNAVWKVTEGGLAHELRIVAVGLELSGSDNTRSFLWAEIREVSFPAAFSVSIVEDSGHAITLGFISATEQREFRATLDESVPEGDQMPGESAPIVEKRETRSATPPAMLLSLHVAPGRTIVENLGLVTSHTVISRNAISDFGSDLKNTFGGNLGGIEKAIQSGIDESMLRLQRAGRAKGADTVLGVSLAIESVTDKAQAIVMSGTAVRTILNVEESGSSQPR